MRIIKYVNKHHRVTLFQIQETLILDEADMSFLSSCVVRAGQGTNSPNDILQFVSRPKSNQASGDYRGDEYQLTPSAVFSYNDYMELQAARRQSAEAKHFSLIAIQLSLASLVIGTLIGLLAILAQLLIR